MELVEDEVAGDGCGELVAVEDVAIGLVELLHWFGCVGVDGSGEVGPEWCGFGEGDGGDGDDGGWVGDGGRQASQMSRLASLARLRHSWRSKCRGPSTPLRSGRDDTSFLLPVESTFEALATGASLFEQAYLAKIFRKSWNFGVGRPASSRGAP